MKGFNPKIFIGSSSEGKAVAQLIQDLINKEEETVSVGWWEDGVFKQGETFIESLHRILGEHNSGIFVATPDDLTVIQDKKAWTARGNVLLEYGMFSGVHGRHRVTLAVAGEVELPTDLNGVNLLRLKNVDNILQNEHPPEDAKREFRRMNRSAVAGWIDQVRYTKQDPARELFDFFPKVANFLVDAISGIKNQSDESVQQRDLDLLASDMIGAIAATLDTTNYGINESLVENIARLVLPYCTAIHAVDVIGPRGWIHPRTYRYLAPQIRRYIQLNTDERGVWNLLVSSELQSALDKATKNAKTVGALDESQTDFDNPEYFQWRKDINPKLEFSRTLLWSKRELLSPVAEAVIAIHVAFNVPLFFVERDEDSEDRDVDYIFFKVKDRVEGFYGFRADNYASRDIRMSRIPRVGSPVTSYWNILATEGLLLAHDARYVALAEKPMS